MTPTNRFRTLSAVLLFLISALVPIAAADGGEDTPKAFDVRVEPDQEWSARLREIAADGDLGKMRDFIAEVQAGFASDRAPSYRAQVTSIGSVLAEAKTGNPIWQDQLLRTLIHDALARRPPSPFDREGRWLVLLGSWLERQVTPPEHFRPARLDFSQLAVAYLSRLHRIAEAKAAESVALQQRFGLPQGHLAPKSGDYPAGVDPASITEPDVRADYETRLAANSALSRALVENQAFIGLQRSLAPRIKRQIIAVYQQHPHADDLAELRQLLEASGLPEAQRNAIFSGAQGTGVGTKPE